MIPHEELGIGPNATLEEAETAYRQLMLRSHPDTLGEADDGRKAEAEARTRVLNDAIAAIRSRRGAGARYGAGAAGGPSGWEWEPDGSWGVGARATAPPPDSEVSGTICAVCGHAFPTRREFRTHAYEAHRIGKAAPQRDLGSRLLQPAGVWLIVTVLLFGLYAFMGLCLGTSCDSRPDVATQAVVGALFAWLVVVPVLYWHFSD